MRIMSIRVQRPPPSPSLARMLHILPLLPLRRVLRVLPPIECQCRIRSMTSDRLRCRHLAPQSVLKCKVPSLFVRIVKFHLKQTTQPSNTPSPHSIPPKWSTTFVYLVIVIFIGFHVVVLCRSTGLPAVHNFAGNLIAHTLAICNPKSNVHCLRWVDEVRRPNTRHKPGACLEFTCALL